MSEINLKKAAKKIAEFESHKQPVELKQQDVRVLFESLGFEIDDKISGSHIVVRHSVLAAYEEYTWEGRFSYPRKSGTKVVKQGYYKSILRAAKIVYEELRSKERGEGSEADT